MKIMKDKNVDLKKLKRILKVCNLDAEIIEINIENRIKKLKQIPALGILGISKFPMRLSGKDESKTFEKIKSIVGKEKLGDVLHIHEAVIQKVDYLISQDDDIISKREEINTIHPNLKILTLEEFENQIVTNLLSIPSPNPQ